VLKLDQAVLFYFLRLSEFIFYQLDRVQIHISKQYIYFYEPYVSLIKESESIASLRCLARDGVCLSAQYNKRYRTCYIV